MNPASDRHGPIAPHGIVVVLAPDALTIDGISENVGALLGIAPRCLFGRPVAALVDESDAERFTATLRQPRLAALNPHDVLLRHVDGQLARYEAVITRAPQGRLIVEFEQREAEVEAPRYGEAQAPIERLAQAPTIGELLAGAVRDLRAISGFDRVIAYRFDRDWQSTVVAEASPPDSARSYLGRTFPATHVPDRMRRDIVRHTLRIVPDAHAVPVYVLTDAPDMALDLARTTLGGTSPDLLGYIANMGSRAALTISIVSRGRLWGMIACHHDSPRRLSFRKRAVCELIGHMLTWQLDVRLEAERLHEEARRRDLQSRLKAQARTHERQEQLPPVERSLATRNEHAAALIKLHDDIAAAIPARHAIIDVILAFAARQTGADGSALEALTESEIIYEAATGTLAPLIGKRGPRGGSFSGMSADLHAPLRCDDAASDDVEPIERDICARSGIVAMAVVPIALSESTTVAIKVVSAQRAAFGDDDLQTLKLAATNLVTALRSAQKFAALAAAEREQRTYARQLRALHAIASRTTSNRRDQIDAALHLGLVQLDLDGAFLGVIDYAAQEFVIENSVSRNGALIVQAGMRIPLGRTRMDRALLDNGVRIVQDVAQLEAPPAFDGWASYIGAPLFIRGVNYGEIGFISHRVHPQPFSEANIEFVAVAAELIASAIERGHQRERLEMSEARCRAVTESIPELVWVVDEHHRFEYVNARWTNYTGLTLAQSREPVVASICDSADLALINTGREVVPPTEFACEVRLRRHDGAYRWHLVRSVPFQESAGAAGKWLVTATDIEQSKSNAAMLADVHDAALAATQAKSRFLATMSHEIRTPMNAVIGMTELLLLTVLSDEQREYIEIVRDSGQSLLRVLNDILDYSKIEAGKLELETVHFDLAGQVDSVVELLRAQYQLKGVRLTTRVASDVPPVVAGDPGRLRQILLNLVGNALKFTAEGGAVHIDVIAEPAADGSPVPIRFTVEDTGIGIPPATVGRLFQPFSQGDESTTRKYGGTGLGLSICAQLVSLMNGQIGVQSTPGVGSAFWFSIPLRAAKTVVRPVDPRKRGQTRPKPVVMRAEKILLVEDNEINTFLALKQLQRIGFIVSAVNNGQQAVEAVARERFDLVFMDCHMPEMDGFEATREIRRMEAGTNRHLPIVAMTADARTEDQQNCLRSGMDDYVSKPTSIDSLRAVLDRWLPTPDRRQNSRSGSGRSTPPASFAVAKLLELFGDDRDAVITLLTAAAGSIKADAARIENCAGARDFAAVAEAAHRLKGTSASIRSTRLGEISAAVEQAANTSAPLPAALLRELRAAVDVLVTDVERHGKQLATID